MLEAAQAVLLGGITNLGDFNLIVDTWNQVAPLTWVSHSLIWLGFQTVGQQLGIWWWTIMGAGRIELGLIGGYLMGASFYGHREIMDLSMYLSLGHWGGIFDSILDFVIPGLINTVLLYQILWARRGHFLLPWNKSQSRKLQVNLLAGGHKAPDTS